jgi:hypothetical protein
MKTVTQSLKVALVFLAAAVIISSCKTTAATHKHEFKKELHQMERSKH